MDRTERAPGEDVYHLAMKAVVGVADAVAVAAAVVGMTVAVAAAAIAVVTAAAEIAAGRTVGEGSTEARLETWYENSEHPCVERGREEGREKVVSIDWGGRREEKEGRDRCLGGTTRG